MAKALPLNVHHVADWFINRVDRDAGETITHLALQKLVYFAQAWHLANRGKPLIADDFQAWAHGPVTRALWDRFKAYSWQAIPPVENAAKIDGEALKLLRLVFNKYGGYGAKKLEKITHERDSPWTMTRGSLGPEEKCDRVIPKKLIRDYFGGKIGKAWS